MKFVQNRYQNDFGHYMYEYRTFGGAENVPFLKLLMYRLRC